MLANRDQWFELLVLDDEGARGALEGKAAAPSLEVCRLSINVSPRGGISARRSG